MKRCVLQEPGRIDVVNVPEPHAGPGDVVIRVRAALTCGTDLKAYRRGHPKMPCPTPFGHEFSGEIVEIGKGVSGLSIGEAVMSTNSGPCGACYFCDRAQENLCETIMDEMVLGGFGEYLRIPARVVRINLFAKPDHLSFAEAALLEPLSSVMHGIDLLPGRIDNALILGAGPVALLWLVALKDRGVARVGVAGRRPEKLAVAHALGADAVAVQGEDVQAFARELSGGRGPDLVVECTGMPEVWRQAYELPRVGGTAMLFGGCAKGTSVSIDTHRLHYESVALLSSFHFTPRNVSAAYSLLTAPGGPWSRFITSHAALEEVPALFARMADPASSAPGEIKTAVLPRGVR